MVKANRQVRKSGIPNFLGEKIVMPSNFNFGFIEEKLTNYDDKEVIDLLKFGFPLSHNGKTGSKEIPHNHTGATFYPEEMKRILSKEIEHKSIIGPFKKSPFGPCAGLNPVSVAI